MAHWAEVKFIDGKKIVQRVTVGNNSEPDEGYQWLIDNHGGEWVKTSYNGNIRKNFAGPGYEYDEVRDAFIAPKPECHPDKISLNENTCQWNCSDASHVVIQGEL
jgi:hypothetical protein